MSDAITQTVTCLSAFNSGKQPEISAGNVDPDGTLYAQSSMVTLSEMIREFRLVPGQY
jgi:hypothetical protein